MKLADVRLPLRVRRLWPEHAMRDFRRSDDFRWEMTGYQWLYLAWYINGV